MSENVLGLDYGLKRVGLAIGDSEQKIAFPRKILINKGQEYLLKEIAFFCQEEEVKKIVVGLPINLKGEKSEQTEQTELFINYLRKNINLPVLVQDERLSTKEADKLLFGRKKGKGRDDTAAMIILQSYFDQIRISKN